MSSAKHTKSDRAAVAVRGDNIDQALRVLKKKMQRDGVFRDMKAKSHFKSAGELKREAEAQAIRRSRKKRVKSLMSEGLSKSDATAIVKGRSPR